MADVRPARFLAALAVGCLITTCGVVFPATAAQAAPSACGPSFSDALTTTPWPLRRLRPELAWSLTRGDGITVAVIDSGVSTIHPSLTGQVLPGKDYVQAGGVGDCDEVAHGTFVAGIIAGIRLKNSGFYGVAPASKILPIRVLKDDTKSTDTSVPNTVADAITFAVSSGARVINLSLVTQKTPQLEQAVANAVAKDVVVVAAAGNDGASTTSGDKTAYPAAMDGVIAVAGVDESDKHVSTSTTGDYVDVAAPGVRIEGPAPQGGGFGSRAAGGTSFAAPYVAGVAALIRAYYPKLTAKQVADRIANTADHPATGRNDQVGYGVVNPYRAVTAVFDGSGAGVAQISPRAIGLGKPRQDPLHGVMLAAIWTSAGGMLITIMVLVGGAIARRGRARDWQPGPLATGGESPDVGIRRRLNFTPVTGRTLNITAPTVTRQGGSEGQRAIIAGRRAPTMPGTSGMGNR